MLLPALPLPAQQVPSPADVLGFEPGADSTLADWTQIGTYLTRLSLASPVVRLDTIGTTTLGKPLLLLTFASPAHMPHLAALRRGQALLADPRRMSAAIEDSLARHQPAVVLINNNIHSTEIASSQMQLTLAHRLATDARYRRFLDSTIVLMIPSANPDGLDTVVAWYRAHRGTRYEGGPLPWLYHPYAGHDNNRDWYMISLPETRAISRVLYREWFPEVVWDVHQMGSRGARLFVPPFSDPVNPNLDPMLVSATNLVGAAMGSAVLDAGKTGVSHQRGFTLWWHGGFRTVPARHNMIGILSEAASVRLASPISQSADSLRQPDRGVNYPAVWEGGRWRMSDIVEYELLAAEGLLRLVATQREQFVRRFVRLGRRAVAAGEAGDPFAFLIPPIQRDPHAAALLANTLIAGGIDVYKATARVIADRNGYPPGTIVIPLAQPFRAHVKDLLERQEFPEGRTPYDVAGWSLGHQMGVEVTTVRAPFTFDGERQDSVTAVPGTLTGAGRHYVLRNESTGELFTLAAALAAGSRAWLTRRPLVVRGTRFPTGSIVIERLATTRPMMLEHVQRYGFDVVAADLEEDPGTPIPGMPRVGLYRPWTASMDEGWTRFVFDRFGLSYVTITDSLIRAGDLDRHLDVLILPDLSEQSIRSGRSLMSVPERFAGGLGEAGVRNVTEFVRNGGTLVALDASSDFAISALNLPVRNVLADEEGQDSGSRFRAPGSIFGVATTPGLPITSGVADTVAVFFDSGRAFAVEEPARIVARYVDEPLISGYVRAPQRVASMGAVVVAPVGRGRAVLFGFRPQHRGQTYGTFKLLFNAVLLATASRDE